MSALFNLQSLMLVLLLLTCTSAYIHHMFPRLLDSNKDGPLGILWKFARIGERMSPYVSLACVFMASTDEEMNVRELIDCLADIDGNLWEKGKACFVSCRIPYEAAPDAKDVAKLSSAPNRRLSAADQAMLCAVLLLLVSAVTGLVRRDAVPVDEDLYPEPKYFNLADARKPPRLVIMPWDMDADVQVTEVDLYYLAAHHNMTVYYYKYGDMKDGRYFLLDVNPHFEHRDTDDSLNLIDARWIDMATGLFIDITAARYHLEHPAGEGILYDKNGHEFRDTYVYPLRNTTFEGVRAMIPFRYKDMLESEYGKESLRDTTFHGHVFDEKKMQWVLESALYKFPGYPVLSRSRRAERLNERLRGAQRVNVDDDSFNLNIDGLASAPTADVEATAAPPLPSSDRKRKRAPDESDAEPVRNGIKSPVRSRISAVVIEEEVGESPSHAPGSGRRRKVLLGEKGTDATPPPSSPLARRARHVTPSTPTLVPTPQQPQTDELSPDQGGELPAVDRLVDAEASAEEAEEIDPVETARVLGKNSSRHAPRSSPELGSAPVEAEEEEPRLQKRAGKKGSPAKQKQPAKGPPRRPKQKAPVKQGKKTADDDKDGDGDDGVEITVQRFVKKRGGDADDADPLQSDMAFANRAGESVVDVFAQVCEEVVASTLTQLQHLLDTAEGPAKKKECRIKMRAIEAYREELRSRLLQHAIHLNHWHTLRKQVRKAQKEKLALREEIIRLNGEREQVALRMDAVRIKHETNSKESTRRINTSALMHDIELAVEQGRDAPEVSRQVQRQANLELLIAQVSDLASSGSSTGGLLHQVRDFNAFLERAALALESR
ncbi:hypothetical protein L249_0657 [Ophiocordyceps polyrhachis-furcata BCC 54312]|uniref:Uncharacterized protein n=1 Tax=Ophiocordyceps polyrhachis-furcata BCC 54312 TaxID=1330021 RepID=A0A367LFS9_9HYPO|nr:hypothetical protein L249_0657 [Ophiocordyceps polyrhachis-furcata BCC 54312]